MLLVYPMIFWDAYMSLVLSLPLVKNFGETGKVEVGSLPFHNHGLGGSQGPNLSIFRCKVAVSFREDVPKKTLKQFARGLQKDCWNGIELVFRARCAYFVCRCNSGSTFCDFSECSNSEHFVTMGCEGLLS